MRPEKALVQLSLRGKTTDILWFTFFHEIGHIIKHSKKEFFIEIDDKTVNKSLEEVEADEYAAETLISSSQLNEWLERNRKLNAAVISDFAKQLNIAPGIVGRLQYMNRIRYSDSMTAYFSRNERFFQAESERLFQFSTNADFGISRTVKSTGCIIC